MHSYVFSVASKTISICKALLHALPHASLCFQADAGVILCAMAIADIAFTGSEDACPKMSRCPADGMAGFCHTLTAQSNSYQLVRVPFNYLTHVLQSTPVELLALSETAQAIITASRHMLKSCNSYDAKTLLPSSCEEQLRTLELQAQDQLPVNVDLLVIIIC